MTGNPIRLAMLGMIEGNGHPYSWSAIINGFDPHALKKCPYPTIIDYLGKQPKDSVGFDDAAVTHIWTDNPTDAARVSEVALIPNRLAQPEDAIGKVDAVIIATDDGSDHVRRCRPFVEANLPVFVDKPLATTASELTTFIQWKKTGARILSSSGLRFDPDMMQFRHTQDSIGDLRWISSFTCKTWERYGIHALEFIQPLLGPGFQSIRLESDDKGDVAYIRHKSGVAVTIPAIHDAYGGFGKVQIVGTKGTVCLEHKDTYSAFRGQLRSFIDYLKSDQAPYPFAETIELMRVLIAGIESRKNGSVSISLPKLNLYEQSSF